MRRQDSRRRRGGSALVESVFVLMTMLAILVGALDIAKVIYLHQSLVERARSGAHWSSVNDFHADQVRNMVVYDNASPTPGAKPVLWRLTTAMVNAELRDPNTSRARVEVTIHDYPYDFLSPWIAGAYTARPIVAVATHEPSLP